MRAESGSSKPTLSALYHHTYASFPNSAFRIPTSDFKPCQTSSSKTDA